MAVEFERCLFEVADKKLRDRSRVPIERGANPVTHSHAQLSSSWQLSQRVLGIEYVKVRATDSDMVIERTLRERVTRESVEPPDSPVGFPIGRYLVEVNPLAHPDVANFHPVDDLGNSGFWEGHADSVHPSSANLTRPDALGHHEL